MIDGLQVALTAKSQLHLAVKADIETIRGTLPEDVRADQELRARTLRSSEADVKQ